jgi:hypothetical protein
MKQYRDVRAWQGNISVKLLSVYFLPKGQKKSERGMG